MTGAIDPDCQVGKHPACPGYTFVERGEDDDILEVPCACRCHVPPRVRPADRHE